MSVRKLHEAALADIAFSDIEGLIADEAEEDVRLEFKRDLPARDKQADPWMQGGKRLGDPARDGIAKEVVALANAYGGVIVVGVDESDDNPRRARGPEPFLIPRVVECAERLLQSLDGIIDPPLPVLAIRGIEKPESDGHGVIVIRTSQSTRSPHGHGRPPQVFIRRAARSEPMTMRDIQSILFETRTRGERVRAVLEERRQRQIAFTNVSTAAVIDGRRRPFDGSENVFHFRCTAVSSEDLNLRAYELLHRANLIRPTVGHSCFGNGQLNYEWKPALQGVETVDNRSDSHCMWYFGNVGIADASGFQVLKPLNAASAVMCPSWLVSVAAQVISLADYIRRLAAQPSAEFVLECEYRADGAAEAVYGDGIWRQDDGAYVKAGSIRIGPFSIGSAETMPAMFAAIEREIWHAFGLANYKAIELPPDGLHIAI